MIIRNTPWSIQFLQSWWDRVDRIDGMDQHVFDIIYNDLKHNHDNSQHKQYNENRRTSESNKNGFYTISSSGSSSSSSSSGSSSSAIKDDNSYHTQFDNDHHSMDIEDEHIVLLDYDEINSHIPAFQNQKSSSSFLHLAGLMMIMLFS